MYDIIIIGMGIAGITSAIYAKRSNLKVLMLDKSMPGGLLNNIEKISNYPGIIEISGPDFAMNLFDQIKELNIEYKLEEVTKVDLKNEIKKVTTTNATYEGKNIILAMGRKPKFLGLDNEKDYLGRGLSTCAVCDGNFYKDKPVAVVGAGSSALQESLYLSKMVSKVYLLNRRDGFRGENFLVDQVKNNPKIEIIYNVNIKEFNEVDGKIDSIILDNDKKLDVKGVFIYIGYRPDTEILKDYKILNEEGYIVVDNNCETNIKGVYAAGDVIKKSIYQLVTAASEGATIIYKINEAKIN